MFNINYFNFLQFLNYTSIDIDKLKINIDLLFKKQNFLLKKIQYNSKVLNLLLLQEKSKNLLNDKASAALAKLNTIKKNNNKNNNITVKIDSNILNILSNLNKVTLNNIDIKIKKINLHSNLLINYMNQLNDIHSQLINNIFDYEKNLLNIIFKNELTIKQSILDYYNNKKNDYSIKKYYILKDILNNNSLMQLNNSIHCIDDEFAIQFTSSYNKSYIL